MGMFSKALICILATLTVLAGEPAGFGRFHKPVKVDIKPASKQYALPVDLTKLANRKLLEQRYQSEAELALLKKNGFGVMRVGREDNVAEFYMEVRERGIPVFVTSDSLLHLYHMLFQSALEDIETRYFVEDLRLLSNGLLTALVKERDASAGEARKALELAIDYLTVAGHLLSRGRELQLWQRRQAKLNKILKQKPSGDRLRTLVRWLSGWGEGDVQVLLDRRIELARARVKVREKDVKEIAKKLTDDGYTKALEEARWQLRDTDPGYDKDVEMVAEVDQRKKYGRESPLDHYARFPDHLRPDLNAHVKALVAGKAPALSARVKREVALIDTAPGFRESPVFTYPMDFSQFRARGHYTKSTRLRHYFQAMMWFGRATFLAYGGPKPDFLVSPETAQRQTMAAAAIEACLRRTKLADGRSAREVWDRIYTVTSFCVGDADDLTPIDYHAVGREAKLTDWKQLAGKDPYAAFQQALAKQRLPRIYGGTGKQEGPRAELATEKDLLAARRASVGMRFMGQRYVPDSDIMGRLVYPSIGPWTGGKPLAFTAVKTQNGISRCFPRGLDLMTVLGSKRARALIKDAGDDRYERFDEVLTKIRKEFAELPDADWQQNLYWAWLDCLRELQRPTGKGYPTFMRTAAWTDKQLNAALGSWAQLRHDTILYAKSAYTMTMTGVRGEPMVEGYVEPVPLFYAKLLALLRMTRDGLKAHKVLNPALDKRMLQVDRILTRLIRISQQELANKVLTKDDYKFINRFGKNLTRALGDYYDTEGSSSCIVADVHTDQNSGKALEEGTGFWGELVVIYPMPDGGLVLGMGPAFTYYEFKQPMNKRLTDKEWWSRVSDSLQPWWGGSFSLGAVEKHPLQVPDGGEDEDPWEDR